MRAEITQQAEGYRAVFERNLAHSSAEVWEMLTDNSRLKQWFEELQIGKSGQGGHLIFDMGDGAAEELEITEYEEGRILAFDWWGDNVRFEVENKNGESLLRLVETIQRITPQTAKDLAGWHVCLDAIESILDEGKLDRAMEWQHWHEEYKRLLDSMTVEFE